MKKAAAIVVPPPLRDLCSTGWRLQSGAYAVAMRTKLERALSEIPPPVSTAPLRVFQGLYHAPQPVFLNQAFREIGISSTYETLDLNPGFPMVNVHHPLNHPDIYREHAEFRGGTLLQTNPAITSELNLQQIEDFFFQRWPKYDVFHFNWFISFLPDNLDVEFLRRSGRPVYFHFRGCFVLTKIVVQFTARGESVADACRYCKARGWRDEYFSRFHRGVSQCNRVFASTPNLCHCSGDFEYLPNSLEPGMEDLPSRYETTPASGGPLVVLHAPAHAGVHQYKGTPYVQEAVETLRGEGLDVELRLVEKMSRTEAVKHYGQGDVFVEQLHLGSYGNTGIEAMAHGMPVISSHHPSHAHLAPGCPVIHADPLTLVDRLRELAVDRDLREEDRKAILCMGAQLPLQPQDRRTPGANLRRGPRAKAARGKKRTGQQTT